MLWLRGIIIKGQGICSICSALVCRIEGRVQRFTFMKDEAFELSEQREQKLMALAEDNKVVIKDFSMHNIIVLVVTVVV